MKARRTRGPFQDQEIPQVTDTQLILTVFFQKNNVIKLHIGKYNPKTGMLSLTI